MEAGKSILSAARNRGKSAIDIKRAIAQASGDFFQEILPTMYDASIIDGARFLTLMSRGDVQSALSTKELIDLAIYWEVTPSASEFWKRHKSRDELVKALQKRKEALDVAARMKAAIPVHAPSDAGGMAPSGKKKQRRMSPGTLARMFDRGLHDHHLKGDLFGTHGDYTDGIIYMARRLKMDNANVIKLHAENHPMSDAISDSKMPELSAGDENEQDEFFPPMEINSMGNTSAAQTIVPHTPQGSISNAFGVEGSISGSSDAAGGSEAPSNAAIFTIEPEPSPPRMTLGQEHAHKVMRIHVPEYDGLAQIGGLPSSEPAKVQQLPPDDAVKPSAVTTERAIKIPVSLLEEKKDEPLEFNPDELMDMDAFIAKHSALENTVNVNGSPSRISPESPHLPNSPAAFANESPTNFPVDFRISGHTDDGGLPDKLSKLDLYYRPVRDSDRVVVVMHSPRAERDRPTSRFAIATESDALDTFINNRTGTPMSGSRSPVRKALSPRSPGSGDEHLHFRHRLGGRAGKLARDLADRLRGELTTVDIHLSRSEEPGAGPGSPEASPNQRRRASVSAASTAYDDGAGFGVSEQELAEAESRHDEGIGKVLDGIVNASRTKQSGRTPAQALGTDVQYDGVVRQVGRMAADVVDSPSREGGVARR